MKRKELTKTLMIILNYNKTLWSTWFIQNISAHLELKRQNSRKHAVTKTYKQDQTEAGFCVLDQATCQTSPEIFKPPSNPRDSRSNMNRSRHASGVRSQAAGGGFEDQPVLKPWRSMGQHELTQLGCQGGILL